MEFLRKCWLPAVWSRDLKGAPVPITVLGARLVVFRDGRGAPVILEDRCPHRGVALSEGYLDRGCLTCPYHGWRFDGAGKCVQIPSLPPEEKIPEVQVPSYQAREQEGMVWLALSETPHLPEPPRIRHLDAEHELTCVEIEGNYIHLMENLVDNPHAGYIHAGLIRGEPTQRVQAEITETPHHIEIRTTGEKTGDSLLFKLLGKKGEPVGHVEEYLAPNQMVSTYTQLGHVAGVQSFIVPVNEHRTRWFFRTFLRFGPMTSVVFPVYKRVVHRILMQDADVVKKVDRQELLWPGRKTVSTRSDVPSVLVARAARAFAQSGPDEAMTEQKRTIHYML